MATTKPNLRKARTLKVLKQSKGLTNKLADLAHKALKPGLRISKTGNLYYETRKNRSDVNPSKNL